MELLSLLVIVIVVIYFTKNSKGKQVLDHAGNAMVNLAASADDASAALRQQCRNLLSDEELAVEAAKAKAKIAAAKKVKKSVEDLDDAE